MSGRKLISARKREVCFSLQNVVKELKEVGIDTSIHGGNDHIVINTQEFDFDGKNMKDYVRVRKKYNLETVYRTKLTDGGSEICLRLRT